MEIFFVSSSGDLCHKMAYIVQVAETKKTQISTSFADNICDTIRSRMPEIYITRVEAVHNKFINAAYQLRKAQYELTVGFSCPTETLYHATAEENVTPILKDNLDWRRVKRSRFGCGVSFSSCPSYANKFCNERNGVVRAFVLCEVLTGKELRVSCNYSQYPRKNIDTYKSKSNMVVVKFEDDAFNPKCVIYYQTTLPRPYRPLSTRNYVGFEIDSESFTEEVTRHIFRELRQRYSIEF